MKRFFLQIIYSFFLFHSPVSAQTIPVNESQFRLYSFVKPSIDQITNSKELAVLYQKLYSLKKGDSSVVSIVHIGDSHLQAGYLTSVVRSSLQNFFGNASHGRCKCKTFNYEKSYKVLHQITSIKIGKLCHFWSNRKAG